MPVKEVEIPYSIDLSVPTRTGMHPSLLLGRRLCSDCRAQVPDTIAVATDPSELVARISSCCRRKHDYLTSTAPLAEIAFRVVISRRNRPQTPGEIARTIVASRTQVFVRKITPQVFAAIMAADDYYGLIPHVPNDPGGSDG